MPVAVYAESAQDAGYAVRGASKFVQGAIAIPKDMIEDSRRFIFPVGILTGAARGAFQTVAYTVSGTLDAARAAAPYAKYLLFL